MKAANWKNAIGLLWLLTASAQPSSQPLAPTKWNYLRTHHADIVFKGNIYREAQRVANTLDQLYHPIAQSLHVSPPRITIILRNQKAYANGFITLGPRRAEFNTFPSQDYNFIGTNDWLSLLLTHEFRHVVQYAYLKQNFNRLLYWIGGDTLFGGTMSLNLPRWFFEGDAINIETALTHSGRGRIPHFSIRYRADLLAHKRSYSKQVLGSFKDPVADPYKTGYYLTTYLRRRYGSEVIASILRKTTLPRFFITAVKRATRKTLLQIYEDASQEIKTCWQQQLKDLQLTPATRLNTRTPADYIDYDYPQLDKQGNLIVLKSGIGTVAQFVRLEGKRRKGHVFTPGNIVKPAGFSVAQNKIVWVETVSDIRKKDRFYGVIQRYDTQTGRLKTLTRKSRYGAAALSPDATQIVAFESDEAYNHQLVILNAENGQVIKRLPNPDNYFYLTPQWSEDGKYIVVVKNVRQRVTIACIDIATGEAQDLLPYKTEHLGRPVMIGRYVFYNSAHSGIDNIYAIDLATRQRYQVTSRAHGAYNPILSADGCWLIFNDFTRDGMDVVKMPFDPKQWTPLEEVEDRSIHYYEPIVAQEGNSDVLTTLPDRTYPVKRYDPWRHWLHVHSWLTIKDVQINTRDPKKFYELLQTIQLDILKSKDFLGTRELTIDYLHNLRGKLGRLHANISYTGWYPIISLGGGFGKSYKGVTRYYKYLDLMLKLPLQFVRGQYTHALSGSATGDLRKEGKFSFYRQEYRFLFHRNSKKSLRDIYYPWEQKFEVKYRHTPVTGDYQEQYLHAQTAFAFPGLAKHHALRFRAAYKQGNYSVPRENTPIRSYIRTATRMMAFDYDFPIFYPDWSISYILYVKRLRANIFYSLSDNAPLTSSVGKYISNVSLDLVADMHLGTLINIPQLSVGIKCLYSPEQKTHGFMLVFSMSPGVSSKQE